MKVLITGGAGFIGRWLVNLLPSNSELVVVDSLAEQVHGPNAEFAAELKSRAVCLRCDVRDIDKWRSAAAGSDVVVHLAALTGTGQSMYKQREYIEQNLVATSRLCETLATLRKKPGKVILASSRAVYGEGAFADGNQIVFPEPRNRLRLSEGKFEVENEAGFPLNPVPITEDAPLRPASFYGLTKMWQEQVLSHFARANDVDCITLRLQNVYGPLQAIGNPYTGIVGVFANGIAKKGIVELFEDGRMTRDFVFVRDVVRAIIRCMNSSDLSVDTLNIGSGEAITLRHLVEVIASILDRHPIVKCHGRYRIGDVRHAIADVRAYQAIDPNWHPTPLKQGLVEYLNWFVEQPTHNLNAITAANAEMENHGLMLRPD